MTEQKCNHPLKKDAENHAELLHRDGFEVEVSPGTCGYGWDVIWRAEP